MDPANDYEDTSGYNELFLAVHNGDLSLVQSLLEKYSATETIRGRTLLHVAAARGHEAIAKLFMTMRNRIRDTPLHVAIMENQPEIFHLLLEESNLNAENSFNQSPLHYAAFYNRPEMAKTLLDNGAIIDVKDCLGQMPLDEALSEGHLDVAQVLFKHGAVFSDFDLKNMWPLRNAVRKGNLEMVKLLMANGCNKVDVQNDDGIYHSKTCLELAISSDRLDILQYLMKNGVKDSATVNADKLRLFASIAMHNGSLATFECLIDLGIKTEEAEFIFYCSMIQNFHDVWRYLLTCFSKINANTYFQEKQLHFSIRMGQVESVKAIVNDPANEYESDTFARKLAVYIAVESGSEEILKILLDAGYPVDSLFEIISPLHVAATHKHPGLVKLFLKAGVDVNSEIEHGLTPLHFAACAGQPAVVKFLLANGADPSKACAIIGAPLTMALRLFSPIFFSRPTSRSVFDGLAKVTETLIQYTEARDIKNLVLDAVRIRVSNTNQSNPDSGEIISDLDDSGFRPEIVRCLFNYLSGESVEHSSFAVLYKSFLRRHTPELLHLLMEYNDSNWCFQICINEDERNYKCQLLQTSYSRNVDDLLNTAGAIIWYKNNDEYKKADIEGQVVFIKLIVARLVLLTTNRYQFLIQLCLEYDFHVWREECVREKKVLQRTKVCKNLKFTFYHVLTNSIDKVAGYANNEDFLTAMKSSYEKFPIYADFLKATVEMAERRRAFINDCVNLMLNFVQKCHRSRISRAEISEIFKYLSILDLRRFSAACS